ncbi:acyltransferase family protein [Streptomyces sp. 8L]|uniref:acyltransferase family protein n=1 Tax=Streptomyces sp. 8L TaxID=2877242 RepID=UPI001CD2A9EF|nr:acyltransferase [Streptomyces sp. 8L]MCA1220921.1 acyltransferase family protein [Streptomyces sp. 8L]
MSTETVTAESADPDTTRGAGPDTAGSAGPDTAGSAGPDTAGSVDPDTAGSAGSPRPAGDGAPGVARRPGRPGGARPARLRALDGLRLVAALMVALYHYGGREGEVATAWGASPAVQFPSMHTWFAYGPLGVQIFFVISGFVICMSAWGRSLAAFFASRVSRLMPAYWCAVVLITAVFALPGVVYRTVTASDALLNLTLLQMPAGGQRVIGVDWTLWAEIRFYALFAVCVVLPGVTRRRVVLFGSLWTIGAVLADAAHSALATQILMPEYAPFFVGGMGLYLVHRDHRDPLGWGLALVGFLLGQHYAVADLWHASTYFSYRHTGVIIAIVALGFAAVAAVALDRLRWANWRWLTTAGVLTYPFYLVHEHLGWVVIGGLHRTLGLPAAATLPLTVAAMLLLAWLLHRAVERTLTPRLRALLTGATAGTLRRPPGRKPADVTRSWSS